MGAIQQLNGNSPSLWKTVGGEWKSRQKRRLPRHGMAEIEFPGCPVPIAKK